MIDCRRRGAEVVGGTSLDLDEDDDAVVGDDEIELARIAPPVALDDLVAVRSVPASGLVLTPAPARLAR
ncbi:MAG: hypothetical protein JWN99_1969 [Ilumatobacteraceae bacterium]|nr:hypothetical protein [Ilumatobacteraceae bacterium]